MGAIPEPIYIYRYVSSTGMYLLKVLMLLAIIMSITGIFMTALVLNRSIVIVGYTL